MAAPFPGPSHWAATAAPAPPIPPLAAPTRADLCVVGGGYCGLSAALHLAEQGADTVLLEAREPGWGASGPQWRTGDPGLEFDPSELRARFGEEHGRRLVDFAGRTADCVFDLIDRHAMNVPHVRAGLIQAAHSESGLRDTERRAAQWAALGADARRLGRDEIARKLGTSAYLGGWIDRRGGAIQSLAFARGLARAAISSAGGRLHNGRW